SLAMQVDHSQFTQLCKEAKEAGVDNDLCNQVVPNQPKQSSLLGTLTKAAIVGAILYGTWKYGFSQGAKAASEEGGKIYAQTMINIGKAWEKIRDSIPVLQNAENSIILQRGDVSSLTSLVSGNTESEGFQILKSAFTKSVLHNTCPADSNLLEGPQNLINSGTEAFKTVKEMAGNFYTISKWSLSSICVGGGLWGVNQGLGVIEKVANSRVGRLTGKIFWHGAKAVAHPFSKKMP
ncbi:MAG: hypothetical protein K940chlam6_00388, partial [Chlamydiae bacterium]|nr:hypothetical protein [Chlamydiota bacterium]